MRAKVRATEQIYQNGDTVFYKRDGKERWLGPASVVFQDDEVVRYGGIFVRVSPNRLSKVQDMKSQNKIEHNYTESYSKHSDGVAGKIVRNVGARVSKTVPATAEVLEENNTNMEGTEIDREAVKSRPIKINDVIRYKLDNEWITGTVMSRAGKATGKYKTWYSIKNENNEERSIGLEIPRDSPTVGKDAMRLFLSVVALEKWTVKNHRHKICFFTRKRA